MDGKYHQYMYLLKGLAFTEHKSGFYKKQFPGSTLPELSSSFQFIFHLQVNTLKHNFCKNTALQ